MFNLQEKNVLPRFMTRKSVLSMLERQSLKCNRFHFLDSKTIRKTGQHNEYRILCLHRITIRHSNSYHMLFKQCNELYKWPHIFSHWFYMNSSARPSSCITPSILFGIGLHTMKRPQQCNTMPPSRRKPCWATRFQVTSASAALTQKYSLDFQPSLKSVPIKLPMWICIYLPSL